jgi:hypothetical protein
MYFISYNNFIKNNKNNKNKSILNNPYYWNNWIGNEIFDMDYLKTIFSNCIENEMIFLTTNLSKNINSIIGICVLKKLKYKNYYELKLISKKYKSLHKHIGKKFTNYLKQHYINKKFILIDDSEINNYYKNLGYKKVNNIIKLSIYQQLLNTKKNKIYYLNTKIKV